jgi:transcription elongation factor GreA
LYYSERADVAIDDWSKKGCVSISSPVARALIGKEKGDTVEVNTPGGGRSYAIKKVAYE